MIRTFTSQDNNDSDKERPQHFLEGEEEQGGHVEHAFGEDGNVSVLFLSSEAMKKAFIEASCRSVQIDTSFNFESSKYKLCGMCYLQPVTNRSEFCALAFLSDETARNLKITFECFKRMCSHLPPLVIMVDKDFTEIAVLKPVFPAARILLCYFHVLKYLKNMIATALVTVEVKESIMAKFKAVMYAVTEDIFQENKNDFLG